MNDLEHVEAIRSATKALNSAISNASSFGLRVDINVLESHSVERHYPEPMVTGIISRTEIKTNEPF